MILEAKRRKKNALSRTSSPLVNGNHHVTRRNRRSLTFRHLLHTLLTLVVVVICQIGIASRGVPKKWGLYQKCIKNTHTHTYTENKNYSVSLCCNTQKKIEHKNCKTEYINVSVGLINKWRFEVN